MDVAACNYNAEANVAGSCEYESCQPILGNFIYFYDAPIGGQNKCWKTACFNDYSHHPYNHQDWYFDSTHCQDVSPHPETYAGDGNCYGCHNPDCISNYGQLLEGCSWSGEPNGHGWDSLGGTATIDPHTCCQQQFPSTPWAVHCNAMGIGGTQQFACINIDQYCDGWGFMDCPSGTILYCLDGPNVGMAVCDWSECY